MHEAGDHAKEGGVHGAGDHAKEGGVHGAGDHAKADGVHGAGDHMKYGESLPSSRGRGVHHDRGHGHDLSSLRVRGPLQ